MFACIHGPALDLPKIAAAFSPWFEQTTPDTIVFRVDGLQRLYGASHQIAQAIAQHAGDRANIAIAETAESAILAARNFSGISIAPKLDDLDISSLPLSEELAGTFESWGIHTFEQLAQLPETGIAERFGVEGLNLQRLAKGAIHRPLKIFQPAITFEDRIELDYPVDLLEPLLFLISRILTEQCEKLQSHGMAANEVTISLELDNNTAHIRTLHLPIPMRESKSLLKLLQMDLEAHPPQAATMALSLHLKPVHPRTIQNGIFLPITPAPDKLELTLARIRAIVGEANVGTPDLLNTHHPHPFHLIPHQPPATSHESLIPNPQSLSFRYFHPPLPAKVELHHDRPSHVSATGIHGKVLNAAGPWRTSGGWWTRTAWNRDEWDVTLTNGALYKIYCQPNQRWFIEGSYD